MYCHAARLYKIFFAEPTTALALQNIAKQGLSVHGAVALYGDSIHVRLTLANALRLPLRGVGGR